jgi:hypothetical protein
MGFSEKPCTRQGRDPFDDLIFAEEIGPHYIIIIPS